MKISQQPSNSKTYQCASNSFTTKLPISASNPQFGIGPKEPVGVRQWRKYKIMMAAIFSTLTLGAAGAGYLIYQGLGKKEPAPTVQTPSQQTPAQ